MTGRLAFLLITLALTARLSEAAGRVAAPGPRFNLTPAAIQERGAQAYDRYTDAVIAVTEIKAADRTFDNTVRALEDARAEYLEQVNPLFVAARLGPSSEVIQALNGLHDANPWHHEDVVKAYREWQARGERVSGEDARLLERVERRMVRSGMFASGRAEERLTFINARIGQLQAAFEQNVDRSGGWIILSPAELAQLPADFAAQLEKQPGGGAIVSLDAPEYGPFMRLSPSSELRRRLELKGHNRAHGDNAPVLRELLSLRAEKAALLGKASYASLALEGTMAGGMAAVKKFLAESWRSLARRGKEELAGLLEEKRRDDPSATRVESYDVAYYTAKRQRRLYGVDAEEVRSYFPIDKVVSGALAVVGERLGLRFKDAPGAEVWHPEVRALEVFDADGSYVGRIFLDLFPRENKYGHFAVGPIVDGRQLPDGSRRAAEAVMVGNFPRGGYLTHDEVRGFFHELGHLVHQLVATTRHASTGASKTSSDYVELPSQIFEPMVWEREVLDRLTDRPIPEELFTRMKAAREYAEHARPNALHALRQIALATFDLAVHSTVPGDVDALWREIMESVGLVREQREARAATSFVPLGLSNYAGQYYAYRWSLDLAQRAAAAFRERPLDFRREILEPGASRPEAESYQRFLGPLSSSS